MKVMIKYLTYGGYKHQSRCSIVVSIPACHAGDPGSIPGNGVFSIFGHEKYDFITTKSTY